MLGPENLSDDAEVAMSGENCKIKRTCSRVHIVRTIGSILRSSIYGNYVLIIIFQNKPSDFLCARLGKGFTLYGSGLGVPYNMHLPLWALKAHLMDLGHWAKGLSLELGFGAFCCRAVSPRV